jgi:photosystem II stability/assembly factor-like uncharacterized protein
MIGQMWTPSLVNRAFYSICTNPQNPRTVYAGNMARTFYKSYDGGLFWEEHSIGQQGGSSTIQLMAVHPADSNIMFAGGINLAGLHRSTDGGETWKPCLETPDGFRFELGGSGSLAFDPSHPDTVYCVRYQYGNVFRSFDAGENWEQVSVLPGIESFDNIRAITVCPDSSNIVIASGRRCRIYRSTDNGVTWNVRDSLTTWRDTDAGNFAWSASHPGTLYATAQMATLNYPRNAGLFKSTDYGRSWKRQALVDTSLYAILINPTAQGDEIFLGGNQVDFPPDLEGLIDGDSIVLKTNCNDTTFTDLSNVPWSQNELGEYGYNVWGFAITQRKGFPILLMATNGGVFSTDRITSTIEHHATPRSLTLTAGNLFVSEEFVKGAQVCLTDILGRVLYQASVQPGTVLGVGEWGCGPFFITVTDGLTTYRATYIR